MAFGITSAFGWHDQLFWINHFLMRLSLREDKLEDANAYMERVKSHRGSNKLLLAHAMVGQAMIWSQQGRLEDATSETLAALKIFKELGASENAKHSELILRGIEQARTGELLEIISLPMSVYPPWQYARFDTGSLVFPL
jgi:hypothetical protein